MLNVSLRTICKITKGILFGCQTTIVNEISINSKKIKPNCLFIAIVGKFFDAHDFYKEAISNGCSALLVHKKTPTKFPQILVQDTTLALSQIAKWNRERTDPLIIAITGSIGKTSVKEITVSILNFYGKTLYTKDNFNNLIGISITLLRLDQSYKFAVIEIGANKPGEIYHLVNLVRPSIALINNIYPVHLKGFKSLLGVAEAKQEIFSGLSHNGIAIINADSNNWNKWKKKLTKKTVLFFSVTKKKTHFYSKKIKNHSNFFSFIIQTPIEQMFIKLPLPGYHSIANTLAATAITCSIKVPINIIKLGIMKIKPIPKRLEFITLNNKITIIDDSYNSSVHSTISALKVLNNITGYKILVIGDMKELGTQTIIYHEILKQIVLSFKIDKILSIGKYVQIITKNHNNGEHFKCLSKLLQYLKNIFSSSREKTTILFKSSRNVQLDKIIQKILQG